MAQMVSILISLFLDFDILFVRVLVYSFLWRFLAGARVVVLEIIGVERRGNHEETKQVKNKSRMHQSSNR